jgi:DNA polymerase (family 10)
MLMPIFNSDIADIFDEIADYLEIAGDNPFKIRAYRNASRTIRGQGTELKDMAANGEDFTALPGIGKELAAKILEILETGTARALEKLRERLPGDVGQILKLPNLGPKRVRVLYYDLSVRNLGQLKTAAEEGRIRSLPGFGIKTEEQILQAIKARTEKKMRYKLDAVKPVVDSLQGYLKSLAGVDRVVVAGSYRRCRETVGDLDILVTAAKDSPVMERFVEYDGVIRILSSGSTRASVLLRTGLQVDLRLVDPQSLGAALQYFTGSQAHNIAIRQLGRRQGLKINEYGVFKFDKQVAGETESAIYEAVGLTAVPPELRENRGEIEASREGRLPVPVELTDIKGDLHVHTDASDGRSGLNEMAEAAQNKGFNYIAITEHSRLLAFAGGLDASRLLAQVDEIDRLNEELSGFTILKSIEVDILKDGRLDLPDDVLGRLDLVVGSVHSHFGLSREAQTERILRAMERPYFSILAHPSGRLINEREPLMLDMEKIIARAAERGCYLELNANPKRLDLVDIYCQIAKEKGVLISINTDAHRISDFDNMRYGIGQARRGWLEKKDVLNTRQLPELKRLLRKTMG